MINSMSSRLLLGTKMANLYYNAAVDDTWDTLGNWWNDSAYTSPAANTPQDGDTAYLDAGMSVGTSVADVSLAAIICGTINTGGGYNLAFNGGAAANVVNGNAEFYNMTANTGGVGGDALFENSYNSGATVTGNAVFNQFSVNAGSVNGNATFNDSSQNYLATGYVGGDADFYGTSQNLNSVGGNATFHDKSLNVIAVTGNADFYDESSSAGNYTYVSGAITFYDNSFVNAFGPGTGFIGIAVFNDYSYFLTLFTEAQTTINSKSFAKCLPALIGPIITNLQLSGSCTAGQGINGSSILGMT